MAHLHCRTRIWLPTLIRIPNQMATLLYAEHFTLHWLRFRSPTPYFCTGQESESQSVSESISSNVSSGRSRISPRWGRQPSNGVPTYDFDKFSQKLHETERGGNNDFAQFSQKTAWNWKKFGPGGASKMLLCRSATGKWAIKPWRLLTFHKFAKYGKFERGTHEPLNYSWHFILALPFRFFKDTFAGSNSSIVQL